MLEVIELNGMKTTQTSTASNHVYLVDVSGSMFRALPKMKEHLKNSISLMSKPDDTFSIIYFSGRGQCGVVCEGMEVKDASQMTVLHNAVDRWLNVIGLTGFIEPLNLAKEVASRRTNGNPNNFVMLTDGYDNCWNRKDIVAKAEDLTKSFASFSFIEFGWYCDRPLLAKMAEATGGIHLFSDGFVEYTKAFESAVTGAVRVPKIAVNVNKKAKHAVYIQDGQIIISEPTDGIVHVPETVERVHSIVPGDVLSKQLSDDHVYIILYYACKNNQPKTVWNCLERLGDVSLIKQYNGAFSKQELSDFQEQVKDCVLDESKRFAEGVDKNYVPAKDAFTIVDLLNSLANENEVYLSKSNFKYNRIDSKREQSNNELKFSRSMSAKVEITAVVAHSSRANFSIQTVEKGNVVVPENEWNIERVKTSRTKNYTIIRDGIVNIEYLPVEVSKEWVRTTLDGNSVPYTILDDDEDRMLVDISLRSIPLINRNMIEKVELPHFKHLVSEIKCNAAKQKVAKHFKPVNRTAKLATEYGNKAAEWLSSLGIRDYGFSPHSKKATDVDEDAYVANELLYTVKGLSSLPSINAVEKKIKSGKSLTTSEALIAKYLADGDVWTGKTNEIIADQRELYREMSEYIYAIIVGRAWFDGIEDRHVETQVDIGSKSVKMTVDLVEKQIKF